MTKVVVIIGFLVSFAAGLVVGIGTKNPPAQAGSPTTAPSTHPSGPGRGVLPMALNLTPEQQEKMKKIWSSGPPRGHNGDDPRRTARDERDAAIQALLTPEQKTKYD